MSAVSLPDLDQRWGASDNHIAFEVADDSLLARSSAVVENKNDLPADFPAKFLTEYEPAVTIAHLRFINCRVRHLDRAIYKLQSPTSCDV